MCNDNSFGALVDTEEENNNMENAEQKNSTSIVNNTNDEQEQEKRVEEVQLSRIGSPRHSMFRCTGS